MAQHNAAPGTAAALEMTPANVSASAESKPAGTSKRSPMPHRMSMVMSLGDDAIMNPLLTSQSGGTTPSPRAQSTPFPRPPNLKGRLPTSLATALYIDCDTVSAGTGVTTNCALCDVVESVLALLLMLQGLRARCLTLWSLCWRYY
jgi:hypothetical protein